MGRPSGLGFRPHLSPRCSCRAHCTECELRCKRSQGCRGGCLGTGLTHIAVHVTQAYPVKEIPATGLLHDHVALPWRASLSHGSSFQVWHSCLCPMDMLLFDGGIHLHGSERKECFLPSHILTSVLIGWPFYFNMIVENGNYMHSFCY